MMMRLALGVMVILAGVAFVPGAIPAIEEALGLTGMSIGANARTRNKHMQLRPKLSEPPVSSIEMLPTESEADDKLPSTAEGLPNIDGASVLGVLTRIQAHADRADVTCTTIESVDAHEDAAIETAPVHSRWHLAGHGRPLEVARFLASLEGDTDLAGLDKLSVRAHDEQRLVFDLDLTVLRPSEDR